MSELIEELIRLDVSEGIATLLMNGPNANRMDENWMRSFHHTVRGIALESIQGIVVAGTGRHFSSGVSFDAIPESLLPTEDRPDSSSYMFKAVKEFHRLALMDIPVVAAVRGVCIGSGFELALACHYRICDKRAIMGSVETTYGLMPGCGATVMLPGIIGRGRALELILKGKTLGAEEAFQMGIVHEVVHHKELIERARSCVRHLIPFYRKRRNNIQAEEQCP